MRGILYKPGKVNLFMSDGSVLTENDGVTFTRNSATIMGKKYALKGGPPVQRTEDQPAKVFPSKEMERPALAGSERGSAVIGVEPEAKTSPTVNPPASQHPRRSIMSDFDSVPRRAP